MKRYEINKLEAAETWGRQMKRSSKFSSETQRKFKTFAFALYHFLNRVNRFLEEIEKGKLVRS